MICSLESMLQKVTKFRINAYYSKFIKETLTDGERFKLERCDKLKDKLEDKSTEENAWRNLLGSLRENENRRAFLRHAEVCLYSGTKIRKWFYDVTKSIEQNDRLLLGNREYTIVIGLSNQVPEIRCACA